MMQDQEVMRALRTAYEMMINEGHDPDSEYMCEFSLVIQEQPIIHEALYTISTIMEGIANRYVHSR